MPRRSSRSVRGLVVFLGAALLAYFLFFAGTHREQRHDAQSRLYDETLSLETSLGSGSLLDTSPLAISNQDLEAHDLSEHNSPTPLKRGILDSTTYNTLSEKGAVLLCLLSGTATLPANVGQSQWTQFSEMADWGWELTRSDNADYSHVAATVDGVAGVQVGSLEGGVKMEWHHEKETEHGVSGKVYPATNGQYINVFWPADGILFANDNYSPDYMIANSKASITPWKDSSGNALPTVSLKQWSDVIFLSWLHITTPLQRSKLRYVFRRVIKNQDTINIINTIARKKGLKSCFKVKQCEWQVPVWPGIAVGQGEEGFNALLASPNGRGVAWLLIQHKQEMGKRTVKSIRVWNDLPVGKYQPSMMMELVPGFEGPVQQAGGVADVVGGLA